ncbi:MAG TPA: DUF4886 domain-containing protein [Patescibacteria group bacterium]|nr:DUF4886 domain-containing protein [Patescibacteria group bacterium]
MRFFLALFLLLFTAPALAAQDISVLLVGNSYTLRNNLPGMLEQVAAAAPGPKITARVAAKNGANLSALWADKDIRAGIGEDRIDYVVLQEQSFWAMFPEQAETTAVAAGDWAKEAMRRDAKLVIFETWARQPNSFWYTDKRYSFLKTPKNMREKIAAATAALAAQVNAPVAPVGAAFADALRDNPKFPLYEADSHHPSTAGSYLAALVLYKTLTGHSPEETGFVPQGLNAETAATLRHIAAGR